MTAAGASVRDVYAGFAGKFVLHPHFQEAEQAVEQAMRFAGLGDASPCLAITGTTGIGKTTLVKKIVAKYPAIPDGRRVLVPGCPDLVTASVPLLQFEFPPQATVISVARQILQSYGDPKWNRGDRAGLTERVDLAVGQSGTLALLGDEAQRLVDRDGEVRRDDLADWLKERHSRTGCVVILVGLGRVVHLLEKDDQIERRWDSAIRLHPYRWCDPKGKPLREQQADFIGIVSALLDAMPIPVSKELDLEADHDLNALRFFYASSGVIGYVTKVLQRALRFALSDPKQHPELDLALIEKAFRAAFRAERYGLENPFAKDWRAYGESGAPNLPPPLKDDTLLLKRPRRRGKHERARDLQHALTLR